MREPTRSEVIAVLSGLINGTTFRATASEWAVGWLTGDHRVGDPVVRDALSLIGAADLVGIDRPYLYTEEDFAAWLADLVAK